MNVITTKFTNQAKAVGIFDVAEELCKIIESHQAAVIWRRSLTPEVQFRINALAPEQLPSARLILRPKDVAAAVNQIFDVAIF